MTEQALRPRAELDDRAELLNSVVRTMDGRSEYSAARLGLILGRYVSWAQEVRGLPLVANLLFNPEVVDLYIRDAVRERRLAKSSVASYRSVLNRAAEVFAPRDELPARKVGASKPLPPYSRSEIDAFPTWALGQRTALMRDKATALMCLGLGCGLRAREINALRRGDVLDSGGIHIRVDSPTGSRSVPMMRRWTTAFRALINDRDDHDYVFGRPQRSIHVNAIGSFITESGPSRLRVNTMRMRTSWIVCHLRNGAELPTLLEAAGLDRLERLHEYIPHLPQPTHASRSRLETGDYR